LYINTVTFAENTIGFRAAAQTFFSKDEKDMTMDEWATLVVMLQANTAYNPLRGKKQKSACKTERNTVISHLSDPVIINGS
jgi:penicillin-binding protein 1A